MEKWLILQLEQRKQKGREHLVVPESEEVMKQQQDEGRLKGHRALRSTTPPPRPHGPRWTNLNNKVNNLVLDCNSKYKINKHESTQIKEHNSINANVNRTKETCFPYRKIPTGYTDTALKKKGYSFPPRINQI